MSWKKSLYFIIWDHRTILFLEIINQDQLKATKLKKNQSKHKPLRSYIFSTKETTKLLPAQEEKKATLYIMSCPGDPVFPECLQVQMTLQDKTTWCAVYLSHLPHINL